MTNDKNRSVAVLLQGSEPQEDTSSNLEGYWISKHPGGVTIKIRISTSWTEISQSEEQRWIPIEKCQVFVDKNPASQQED